MNLLKNKFATLLLAAAAFFAVSCDDNDEIKVDPNAEFDAVLEVKEAGPANPNADVIVDANAAATIKAKVAFTSTTKSMTRLYITQNIKGAGEVIYKPSENIDLKGDGAVDLTGKDDNAFEFQFTLPVPAGVGTGTVVYKFWTTDGNGDFRDMAKRLAVGPGTITLKYGTATNPSTSTLGVKTYSDLKLSAPSADGTSQSFVSLLNGLIYTIKPNISNPTQEQFDEYISFWDFGYINKQSGGPTLHSTSTYPTVAFSSFPAFSATTVVKNKCYFRTSTKTVANFDAIGISSDLDFITKPSEEFVSNLAANTIIEFVDQYNKKGMIKVLEAVPGNSPGVNFVRITVKVQP